jgi:3-phytase
MSLNILLVNDDGIDAVGIETLFDGLVTAGYNVSVVAPAAPQSAQGSTLGGLDAVTSTFTIEESTEFGPGSFAVNAATAPTALTGLELAELGVIFPGEEVDVVLSGTNEGENIGTSPNISGTVNGALAALFEGFPAIAISAKDDNNPELVFERSALFTVEVLEALQAVQPEGAPLLPEGIGLSINVPEAEQLNGVAMTVIDEEVTARFPIILAPDATEVEEPGPPGSPSEFFDIPNAEDSVFLSSEQIVIEESSGSAISEGAQFLLDRITVSAIDGNWFSSESDRATLETRLDGVFNNEDDSDVALDILLINDDGFDSTGITAQRQALLEAGHNVTVVAPLVDQSFEGSALTIFGPWAAQEFAPGDFAVNATPNTTLSSGLEVLIPEVLGEDVPDLVVSGVGAGPSTGITANSSATIAPVVTSIFDNDIPAIAVSAELPTSPFADTEDVFENAAAIATEVIDSLLETAPPNGMFLPGDRGLNINVPLGGTLETVAFTKLDEATAQDIDVELLPVPGNTDTFRFTFEGPDLSDDPNSEGVNFLADAVTITPLDGNYTADLAPTLTIAEILGLEFGDPTVFDETSTGIGSSLPGAPGADADASANSTSVDMNNLMNGSSEPDVIGTDGADTLAGGEGDQIIDGLGGNDVLRGDLNNASAQGNNGGNDIIYGGAGRDRIGGKGGNDQLFGDEDDDQIWGDNGDDLINGGSGDDVLSGGNGADTFVLALGEGQDNIIDFVSGDDLIALSGGLTFGDISLETMDSHTLISAGDEILATVSGVTSLSAVDFAMA